MGCAGSGVLPAGGWGWPPGTGVAVAGAAVVGVLVGLDPAGSARTPSLGTALPALETPTVDDHRGVGPYCSRPPDPCPLHDLTLVEALQQGVPVAFVVGADRYVAEDALELIEVDYEPLAVASSYGAGVHAYYDGDYQTAYDALTAAIEAGSLDPRLLQKYGKATPEALGQNEFESPHGLPSEACNRNAPHNAPLFN